MIQRIQTVFLLLAAIALGLFLCLPLIQLEHFNIKDSFKGYEVYHLVTLSDGVYRVFFNAIFTGTALGLVVVSIFLFKMRGLQMLLCWFAILLIASGQAFVYYEYRTMVFNGDVILTPWNLVTAFAALTLLMAFSNIRKDENTIKSLDRLR